MSRKQPHSRRKWLPSQYVTDCQAVMYDLNRGVEWACDPRNPHGGLFKELDWSLVAGCRKTKAHRSRQQAEATGDLLDYEANDVADRMAKSATVRWNEDVEEKEELRVRSTRKWLKLVTSVIDAAHVRGAGAERKLTKKIEQKGTHRWRWEASCGTWICLACSYRYSAMVCRFTGAMPRSRYPRSNSATRT